jgi:hypothetical protein
MPAHAANKFQRYRQAKQKRGLRLLRVWVPDPRSPEFIKEAERQAKLLRGRPEEQETLDFIEHAFDWPEMPSVVSVERPFVANVYIEARPRGRREGEPIEGYVVEDHADHVLKTFKTQHEAIEWAKKEGHRPLVARVRHINDKENADHWRAA